MNDRSVQAFENVRPHRKSMSEKILDAFYLEGTRGSIGETITRALFGPKSDNTTTARVAELKGIPLGETVSLVRTGETRSTEQGEEADVLIHLAHATPAQIQAHVLWVESERQKSADDRIRWLDRFAADPRPTVNPDIRQAEETCETPKELTESSPVSA